MRGGDLPTVSRGTGSHAEARGRGLLWNREGVSNFDERIGLDPGRGQIDLGSRVIDNLDYQFVDLDRVVAGDRVVDRGVPDG